MQISDLSYKGSNNFHFRWETKVEFSFLRMIHRLLNEAFPHDPEGTRDKCPSPEQLQKIARYINAFPWHPDNP